MTATIMFGSGLVFVTRPLASGIAGEVVWVVKLMSAVKKNVNAAL